MMPTRVATTQRTACDFGLASNSGGAAIKSWDEYSCIACSLGLYNFSGPDPNRRTLSHGLSTFCARHHIGFREGLSLDNPHPCISSCCSRTLLMRRAKLHVEVRFREADVHGRSAEGRAGPSEDEQRQQH